MIYKISGNNDDTSIWINEEYPEWDDILNVIFPTNDSSLARVKKGEAIVLDGEEFLNKKSHIKDYLSKRLSDFKSHSGSVDKLRTLKISISGREREKVFLRRLIAIYSLFVGDDTVYFELETDSISNDRDND